MPDLTDQFPELTPEGRRILLAQMGRQIPAIQAQNVTPGGEISGPPPAGWRDVPQAPPIGTPLSRSSYTANPGGGMLSGQARDSLMGTGQGGGGASPLEALREQMGVINQLTGTGPQAPQINHYIEAGSPTAGLAQVGGRMVGNQTPDRVVADPAAALQTQIFGIQDRGHDEAQNRLFGRLGEMGRQAISGAQIPLEAMRLLGPGGTLDVNRAQMESLGLPRQEQAQRAAFVRDFITQRTQGGTSIQDALNELRRIPGMENASLPGFQPSDTASTRRGEGETDLTSRLNALHQAASRVYGTPGQGNQRDIPVSQHGAAITHILGGLGSDIRNPAVAQFIVDRFGRQSFDDWVKNSAANLPTTWPASNAGTAADTLRRLFGPQ